MIPERLPVPGFLRRYSTEAMFVAGFLFDFLTMQRIDAWVDLAFQLGYLAGLTALLLLQHWHSTGRWLPGGVTGRAWAYNLEALHFLYGGLLSAYLVLYVRSSTLARPAVFLALLLGVMVINEVPRIRRTGYRMRLGLYAFCVLSFLIYFIPIMVGRIGGWIFLSALLGSTGIVWVIAGLLIDPPEAEPPVDAAGAEGVARTLPVREASHEGSPHRRQQRLRLCAPAAVVLVAIGLLYALRLIPPVPLSVQFHGIYHDVRREDGGYTLVYGDSPPSAFWRRDSRPFEKREGDRLHYFARVFAPSGFEHRVVIRWELYDEARGWVTTDRIPLNVVGGRVEGFRGFAVKANFTAGRWRVTAETDDGRAIATLSFDVEDDAGTGNRRWRILSG